MPEALAKIINSKSKTFITFCFCFVLGVAAFSFTVSGQFLFYLYILLFAVLFFVIIFWNQKQKRFLILCSLFFILGGLIFLISIPNYDSSRIEFYNGQKATLQGWVSAEPDIGISDARYVVSVKSLSRFSFVENRGSAISVDTEIGRKPVSGKIAIKTRIYPEHHYGDELEINCSLQEPENFSDSNFNYKKYLAKQRIWSVCANPIINDLNRNRGNFFIKKMLWLKSAVQSQMSRLWPEPGNSLMAGVLYGNRSGLPKELIDNFISTGVSHIIAVSGYNVSIIAVVLNICLIYIGLSRRQSFWFLISLILAFIFFTGATASVARAGVMAIIILSAQHSGRLSSAGRTLLYAVVIMLLFNPYILIWDVGFQLSFLSTLGLVYLSPILEKIDLPLAPALKSGGMSLPLFLRRGWGEVIWPVLVTTFSAIMATLPLILFQFGRLSLVAPVVNVLILWLVPWLMLFGFLSLISSFIFFPLGQAIAWVAGLGLNYVIIIVDWFGGKSWSAADIQIPVWAMLVMYLGIVYVIARSRSKEYRHAELVSASIKNSGQILK